MTTVNPTSEFFLLTRTRWRYWSRRTIASALLKELNLKVLRGPPVSLILRGLQCLNTTLPHSRLALTLLSLFVHCILTFIASSGWPFSHWIERRNLFLGQTTPGPCNCITRPPPKANRVQLGIGTSQLAALVFVIDWSSNLGFHVGCGFRHFPSYCDITVRKFIFHVYGNPRR